MCECGCVANDERYTLPGPGKSFYLVTLSAGCVDCDGPAGVSIELIEPGTFAHRYYRDPYHTDGPLKFENWSDSKGAAIVTGFRRCEFVKAMRKHLIGLDSNEMGENGQIDEAGADVIAEEMFEDSQRRPELVISREQRKDQPQ
jgi:hypothetical protein